MSFLFESVMAPGLSRSHSRCGELPGSLGCWASTRAVSPAGRLPLWAEPLAPQACPSLSLRVPEAGRLNTRRSLYEACNRYNATCSAHGAQCLGQRTKRSRDGLRPAAGLALCPPVRQAVAGWRVSVRSLSFWLGPGPGVRLACGRGFLPTGAQPGAGGARVSAPAPAAAGPSLSTASAWPPLLPSRSTHRSAPTRPWRSPCLSTRWAPS